MKCNKVAFSIIFIMVILAIPVYPGRSATHNYSILNGNDDIFITETGTVFFDSPLVVLQDTGMELIVVLLFRGITIPQGSLINEANLTVTTNSNFQPDPDANATIYGIANDDIANLVEPHQYPATSSLVNWNISQVTGINVAHTVNITEIVQEIINRPAWMSGNNLGLRIDSMPGDALRHFIARDFKPNQAASLSIRFNEVTPGPWVGTGQAEWLYTVDPYYVWWYDQTVYENFTKYTLGADTQSRITNKDDFNITWASLSRSDNDAEAHYQYAANAFLDFEHYFTFQMTNVINASFRQVNPIVYHSDVYDSELHYFNNNLDMFGVGYRTFAGSPQYYHLDLVEVTGGVRNIVAGTVNFRSNDILYCVLNKTDDVLRLDVYANDMQRENMNYTISLTLDSDWNFRRIEIPQCLELAPSSPNNGYLDRLALGPINSTYVVTLNNTIVFSCDTPECIEEWIEGHTTPHPLDPEPPGYDETGIFTRFNLRLMILLLGLFCIVAPSWAMAAERPSAYFAVVAMFVIIIGIGLLLSIPEI